MTHHLILSLPPTDQNVVCFSYKGPLYCPQVVNVSRSVEKCWCHFCQGFCKLNWCSCLKIFLFLESNLTFQRSCLFKSNCWNEIGEMSVFEIIIFFLFLFFEIQTSLVKDPTHYSMQSFDCLVSWKIEMTRCKI